LKAADRGPRQPGQKYRNPGDGEPLEKIHGSANIHDTQMRIFRLDAFGFAPDMEKFRCRRDEKTPFGDT